MAGVGGRCEGRGRPAGARAGRGGPAQDGRAVRRRLELGQCRPGQAGPGLGRLRCGIDRGLRPGRVGPPAGREGPGLPGGPQARVHVRGRVARARGGRRPGVPALGPTGGELRADGLWLAQHAEPAPRRVPPVRRRPGQPGAGEGRLLANRATDRGQGARDTALLAAYQRGEDLHTLTAKKVLGIAEVTKEHRQLAKAINFGLLYGMGAKAFRSYARTNYGVRMTEEVAAAYREAFFRAYPGLRRWHQSMGDAPRDTRTLTGRRVRRVERFTEKLNLPVQGTGADGLKRALSLLWQRRAEVSGAVPVLAVHDEIVIECKADVADAVSHWLKHAMLDAMAPLVAPVPVEVEVRIGRTWASD